MTTTLVDTDQIQVWCCLDVGKEEHHACALDIDGNHVFDMPLPRGEARLREVFARLLDHGPVFVIADRPNTIGALPGAVARDAGCEVAYLPGLAMRKAAQLLPGDAKRDARDAFVIATTALKMDTLCAVNRDSEVFTALSAQSAVVIGTAAAEKIIPHVARSPPRSRSCLMRSLFARS
nr:IS110 family transposase [Microbacterium chengjingii]